MKVIILDMLMFTFKKLRAQRPCSRQRISDCSRVRLSAEFAARKFGIISK